MAQATGIHISQSRITAVLLKGSSKSPKIAGAGWVPRPAIGGVDLGVIDVLAEPVPAAWNAKVLLDGGQAARHTLAEVVEPPPVKNHIVLFAS